MLKHSFAFLFREAHWMKLHIRDLHQNNLQGWRVSRDTEETHMEVITLFYFPKLWYEN